MQVKLNAFRGDDRPGDIVDIPDSEAAELITHGAAFPVDDVDAGGSDTAGEDDAQGDDAQTVSGQASLAATSETGTETETAP